MAIVESTDGRSTMRPASSVNPDASVKVLGSAAMTGEP